MRHHPARLGHVQRRKINTTAHHISDPKTTVLFVGYQAQGTLGREILEGQKQVHIHNQMQPVRAPDSGNQGLSAHADRKTR